MLGRESFPPNGDSFDVVVSTWTLCSIPDVNAALKEFRRVLKGDQVFVYGREVKDFRTVDYEAISMLNVSATQELARRLEAQEAQFAAKNAELAQLREKNDAPTQKLTVLEARDQRFEERLTRLERSSTDVQLTGLKIQSKSAE